MLSESSKSSWKLKKCLIVPLIIYQTRTIYYRFLSDYHLFGRWVNSVFPKVFAKLAIWLVDYLKWGVSLPSPPFLVKHWKIGKCNEIRDFQYLWYWKWDFRFVHLIILEKLETFHKYWKNLFCCVKINLDNIFFRKYI